MIDRRNHSKRSNNHHSGLLVQHNSQFSKPRELLAKNLLERGSTPEIFNLEQPRTQEGNGQGEFYPQRTSFNSQLAKSDGAFPDTITVVPNPVTGPASPTVASPIPATTATSIRISSAPAPTASKLSSIPVSCSGSSCQSRDNLSSAPSSSSSPASSKSGAQEFFTGLGSSPVGIFFTCLVGILILGITAAILSVALRRWCNRRRKNIIDEDTWTFLNTPKEFSKGLKPDDDALSVKDSEKSFEATSNLASLHPTLLKNSAPSNPFTSHIQQQSRRNTLAFGPDFNPNPPFHQFLSFQPQQQRRLSCFVDDKTMSWMNASVPQPTVFGGMLLAPYGSNLEAMPQCRPTGPIPELMLQQPSGEGPASKIETSSPIEIILPPPDAAHVPQADLNQLPSHLAYTPTPQGSFRASMFLPSATAAVQSFVSRTRSMASIARFQRSSLAREVSLARSDNSTTVESLRERAITQKTDLRANLIGAIQREKEIEKESLEVLHAEDLNHLGNANESEKGSEFLPPPLPIKDEASRCWSPSGVLNGSYGTAETQSFYEPTEKPQPATPRPLEFRKHSLSMDEKEMEGEATASDSMERQNSGESCYPVDLF